MLDLAYVEVHEAACAATGVWQTPGMHRLDDAVSMRSMHARERLTAMVGQESRKQNEQIGD
jgi:hypothetical protein